MSSDKDFQEALKLVLGFEGGLSNHKQDKGGLTNYGVTQTTYDRYRAVTKQSYRSVSQIALAEVSEIYKSLYWNACGCPDMPRKIAITVFDWQVNSGRGVKTLQEAIGAKADGIWGKQTENDLRYFLSKHSEDVLLKWYFKHRDALYKQFASKPGQHVFLKGWLARSAHLKKYLEVS